MSIGRVFKVHITNMGHVISAASLLLLISSMPKRAGTRINVKVTSVEAGRQGVICQLSVTSYAWTVSKDSS